MDKARGLPSQDFKRKKKALSNFFPEQKLTGLKGFSSVLLVTVIQVSIHFHHGFYQLGS